MTWITDKGCIQMCPSCQIDVVAALATVLFVMTLYLLLRRGIIRRGKSLRNIVVVFGLLIVTAVVVGLMVRLAHTSLIPAADMDSGVFAPTAVDSPKLSEPRWADSTLTISVFITGGVPVSVGVKGGGD